MNITIIGAGNMGSAFVKQLHQAGHQVQVTSADGTKASALAAQYPGVQAVAAAFRRLWPWALAGLALALGGAVPSGTALASENLIAGAFDPQTLSQRGIDPELANMLLQAPRFGAGRHAVNLIVNGFCKEVFKELPMEFAVEAQKLLAVSLEGAVG